MLNLEVNILKYIQSFRTDVLNNLFELITMLGEEVLVILLIAILYFAIDKKYAQKFLFVMFVSLSTNGIIKNLVKRPRPFTIEGITCVREETATGYSFPSGHTQSFSTWSTLLAIKYKKVLVTIFVAILIILVAFSRMYLGAHYPSDVVVGAILGIFLATFMSKLYDKIDNKIKLFGILGLTLTPFAIYFLIKSDILFEDFFKGYGMVLGMYFAMIVEEKYAPLKYDVSIFKRVIRIAGAIVIALLIKEGLKLIVVSGLRTALIFETIRYLALVFAAFGLWPVIIKKCKL